MSRQVVTFHYELRDDKGAMIDSSKGKDPIAFLEGSSQIIAGLEEALLSLAKGVKKDIHVPYADAYGAYDQRLVAKVAKNQFPPDHPLKVGDVFQIEKNGSVSMITVVTIDGDQVTIDGNHPMAGKDLHFSIEIVDKRDATLEELDHGHAHPGDGHHHHH